MINKFYKKRILKNKNNKFFYYLQSFWNDLKPSAFLRSKLKSAAIDYFYNQDAAIRNRVDYYNKLVGVKDSLTSAIAIEDYKIPERIRVYYFDSKYYLKHFNPKFRFHLLPGDITQVPDEPSIVKSRPVQGDNANSVLLNLDKCRHFNFLIDDIKFEDKKNLLIGRSGFSQPHRARFYELFANHEMCDLKKATHKSDTGYLDIEGHLQYKYILALEGNDVATNLKWIMSSNSIAVMPKPRFETWFMEGTLIADQHYICIKDDYSDLEEKLNYYNNNPNQAEQIIANAHQYIDQFRDQKKEDIIALLVLKKYFECTNQS
ncbi:glycosyltransferase family 90 protein [Sphingobacterium rhinopitheci]|uniref:glycosyltransferase family 90 protein n=1 Tax=Sphingobacterium rhinopitheci TaxID=2781960 RepID=UPI001F51FE33|nr:glycosyltransferase family 90 protein [Sphingobacterium rhinopitheci]MCI0920710.1 lipopolysaccharide biosynthesis protein [Sphingobacterium rhinopitheci]